MNTRLSFFVLLPFICLSLSAQENAFEPAVYQLPLLNRHSLDLQLNLNGTSFNSATDGSSNSRENESSRLGADVRIGHRYFFNDADHQRNTISSVQFIHSGQSSSNQDSLVSESSTSLVSASFSNVDRSYNEKQQFFEFDQTFHYSYYNSDNSNNQYIHNSHDLFVELPVKIGAGRIEQVQDARHAILLVKALREGGRGVELSTSQMTELSALISQLENRRYFDIRLQQIYAMEQVDSFLTENNGDHLCDARYYAILSDMLRYGNGRTRWHGDRFSLGITPGVHYSESTYFSTNESSTVFGTLEVDYENQRTIDATWQSGYAIGADFTIYDANEKLESFSTSNEGYTGKVASLSAEYGLGFFPNTRTSISADLFAVFDHYLAAQERTGGEAVRSGASLNMYYYISPRFRLSANGFGTIRVYSDDGIVGSFANTSDRSNGIPVINPIDDISSSALNGSFSVGLTYALF